MIILFDSYGKILLQKREPGNKYGIKWGFFGGGVEKGEVPAQAVKREAEEELSIKLEDPIYVGTTHPLCNHMGITFDLTKHFFIDRYEKYKDHFNQKEGVGMKLFAFEEASNALTKELDNDQDLGLVRTGVEKYLKSAQERT